MRESWVSRAGADGEDSFGSLDTVNGSGHDTAGITGAFAAGIKTLQDRGLHKFIAEDADRRRTAAFNRCKNSVTVGKAMQTLIHQKKAFPQGIGHEFRKTTIQR